MNAQLSRHPYNRASFRYSPDNPWGVTSYPLLFVGEISQEWTINGVDPDQIGHAMLKSKNVSGSKNGAITTKMVFAPCPDPDASSGDS